MASKYIPDRNDIVWLDFEWQALVLSSKIYNIKTGLLICSPISTSSRGGATEVPLGNLDKPSVVAASIIQTVAWENRKVKYITSAEPSVIEEVLMRIIPLIGAEALLG